MAGKVYEIAFNLAAKMGGSFSGAFATAATQMTQLQTRVKTIKAEMKDLEKQQRMGAISTLEYAASYEKLTATLYRTEQMQKKLGATQAWQNKAGKASEAGKNGMEKAAMAGAALSVPAMAAVSFDTEMAFVAKQVDGARAETGKLSDIGLAAKADIMGLSKDLMTMPNEVAKAYALGARAGVSGAENLKRVTEIGIKMGVAFELPADQVTTSMAKISNALGYDLGTAEGIAKMEKLADKINYVDDQTVATGEDLMDFMVRTAGVANGMIPTISEGFMVGLGGALVSCGEKSETAGRAMNVMFTKFAAAEAESDKFQGALEQIGLTASQVSQGMVSDADGTIKNIFERVNQLDAVAKNNVLAELIGKDHIDTVTKITGNYDKFIASIRLANSEAAKGSMNKEFAAMNQTTRRKMDGAQAGLARNAVTIGDALLPGLERKAAKLSELTDEFAAFAQRNPAFVEAAVVSTASLVGFAFAASAATWVVGAAASPLISMGRWLFMSRMAADGATVASRAFAASQWLVNFACGAGRIAMTGLGLGAHAVRLGAVAVATGGLTAAQWLWNLALSANPIGLVILGIGALIGVGYLLYQNWDSLKSFAIAMWNDPLAAIATFTGGVKSMFSPVFDWIEAKWTKISGLFSSTPIPGGFTGPGGKPVEVAANAAGGIYGRGAFLTTFAEQSAEAAIPLDGSARAVSLWAQAGQMLGVSPSGSGSGVINISAPFSPVINVGGGTMPVEFQAVLEAERDKFARMLEDILSEQRRLSYA